MRLRFRLVAAMLALVAVGLAAVGVVTYSLLSSSLTSRVNDQLVNATSLTAHYLAEAQVPGHHPASREGLATRLSPEVYVIVLDRSGAVTLDKPSGTERQADPTPDLPRLLHREPGPSSSRQAHAGGRSPAADAVDVGSSGRHGPEYRLLATAVPSGTIVVATRLDTVQETLRSLRNIELAVSIGLLVVLFVCMTVLIGIGLRPLEEMARDADAIAAGDVGRRVDPGDGDGEIPRLGRALNRMLARIEEALSQRARSEERLRNFLADASHELRTPLTSIRGYAELLRREALSDPEARERALTRIEQESARMGELVGDLSVLAREGVGPQPARERVDLAAAAAEAVADARAIDGGRPITLEATGEVPVTADDSRLEQLVHNLMHNALVHTPPGTPVAVRARAEGDRAVLEVADRGPGMSATQAAQVFERFYRADGPGSREGSGLGLFIVASLARTFGGEASVASAPGEGSTFRVELPLWSGRGPEPGTGTGAGPGEGADGERGAGPTDGLVDGRRPWSGGLRDPSAG